MIEYKKTLKSLLLSSGIIMFLIPLVDTYVLPKTDEQVVVASWPEEHRFKRTTIFIFELSNGRKLNVEKHTGVLLQPGDTCVINYSMFQKAMKLNFAGGEYSYEVTTGMLLQSSVTRYFIFIILITALILLFTKIFDKYRASEIGPLLTFTVSIIFLILYLTHD